MARFHNLKAQETECTHQFSWKNKVRTTDVTMQNESQHRRQNNYIVESFLDIHKEKM